VRRAIAGLYAITPDDLVTDRLHAHVEAALRGGARVVQYRRKRTSLELQHEEAIALLTLAKRYRAIFVVNDNVALAHAIGADGVHLGRDDAHTLDRDALTNELAHARGNRTSFIIGISCYDDFSRAEIATSAGADYVAFGSVFASVTKPNAVRAPLELFQRSKAMGIPSVAIGGITRDNVASAAAAGADAVAVITDLFDATTPSDCEIRAREFAQHFSARD
jgi:thiamine-phosphate pyrophosphorylase